MLPGIMMDITGIKEAEGVLQQQWEEEESFFRAEPYLLSIGTPGGHFLHLNPAWVATFGYTHDELKAKRFTEFVCPDNKQASLEANDKLLSQQDVADFTNRWRFQDGTFRWLQWCAPVAGKLICGLAHDVTEQGKVEEALLAGAILRVARVGRRVLNGSAKPYRLRQPGGLPLLGHSLEELVSLSAQGIDPLLSKRARGELSEEIKLRGSITFETQHRTKQDRCSR